MPETVVFHTTGERSGVLGLEVGRGELAAAGLCCRGAKREAARAPLRKEMTAGTMMIALLIRLQQTAIGVGVAMLFCDVQATPTGTSTSARFLSLDDNRQLK